MAPYTLWEFKSPTTLEVVRKMKGSEPLEDTYQHEYQRILWRGMANGFTDAWIKSGVTHV